MTKKIEEQVNKLVNTLSEEEKRKNRLLGRRTERLLIAVEYLKLTAKNLKIVD